MKKLILSLIIAIILVPNISEAAPSQWALSEVNKAKEYDLLTPSLMDKYQDNITREEFAELVVKLYAGITGEEIIITDDNPFSDTSNPEVIKAYNLGIVKGVGGGLYSPLTNITREQIAVMYFRLLSSIDSGYVNDFGDLTFKDKETISSWAVSEVKFLNNIGTIKGYEDNTFRPLRNTSKEEAIALTVRLYENYRLLPPKNITANVVTGLRVNLQWDDNGSDYYKVYESYDGGDSWFEVLDPYGRNNWGWYPEFSVEVIGYEKGDLVQFRVASVKDEITSAYGYSNIIELPQGMTAEDLVNHLYDFYPSMNVNNIQVPFSYYDVLVSNDGTVTSIHLYVDEDGFEKYLQSDAISRVNIAKELRSLSLYYREQVLTNVEIMVIFSSSYETSPDFLEENFIEPDVIHYDEYERIYYVWYPLIDVFSYDNIYFTWYGSYNF